MKVTIKHGGKTATISNVLVVQTSAPSKTVAVHCGETIEVPAAFAKFSIGSPATPSVLHLQFPDDAFQVSSK